MSDRNVITILERLPTPTTQGAAAFRVGGHGGENAVGGAWRKREREREEWEKQRERERRVGEKEREKFDMMNEDDILSGHIIKSL